MLPDKCSVSEKGKQCVNPPEFVVSSIADKDEYMVGVTCEKHKQIVSGKLEFFKMKERSMMVKLAFHLSKQLELTAFMEM